MRYYLNRKFAFRRRRGRRLNSMGCCKVCDYYAKLATREHREAQAPCVSDWD